MLRDNPISQGEILHVRIILQTPMFINSWLIFLASVYEYLGCVKYVMYDGLNLVQCHMLHFPTIVQTIKWYCFPDQTFTWTKLVWMFYVLLIRPLNRISMTIDRILMYIPATENLLFLMQCSLNEIISIH